MLSRLRKTLGIFVGIELVAVGVSFLLDVYCAANLVDPGSPIVLANLIVLPVFYGYGILSRLIK